MKNKNTLRWLLIVGALIVIVGFFGVRTKTSVEKEPVASTSNNKITVNLNVADEHYTTMVPQGSTVYDVMTVLSSTTSFRFNAKPYPGLGYFIDEINGKKNTADHYWSLYVHDAPATVGASSYIPENGETIAWKFE